jgi:hypothetical protein
VRADGTESLDRQRGLEVLIRLALRHRRRADCPGGRACIALGEIDSIAERGTNGPTGPAPHRAASKMPTRR